MNLLAEQSRNEEHNKLQEYPFYSDSEDIYKRFLKERNIDPEEIPKFKVSNEKNDITGIGKKTLRDTIRVSVFDIHGSESDNKQENFGCEDEENSYYCLGGKIITNWINIKENIKLINSLVAI